MKQDNEKMYKNIYEKMSVAVAEAQYAAENSEVPVGCAIFLGDELVTSSHNICEETSDPTDHAELIAIKKAIKTLGREKIRKCELFVTLEPCPMCAGAILHSGIGKVYFASYDPSFGAYDGYVNVFSHPDGKNTEIYGGIMEERCSEMIREFFRKMRNK
ncbi:MAG: nucleoside deaminase [Eubacteriaceae bacterium]|nr:nucleoside deaminase [Eubacteriaceae bacterium]